MDTEENKWLQIRISYCRNCHGFLTTSFKASEVVKLLPEYIKWVGVGRINKPKQPEKIGYKYAHNFVE